MCENRLKYFLFGGEATRFLTDEGTVEELSEHESIDYKLFLWEEGVSQPEDILYEYNGYEDYTMLTKEEYNKLK